MAAVSSIIAAVSIVVGAYSAHQQQEAQKDAKDAQKRATEEQRKARSEQDAINAQQRASERRAQIREERVKRARIIQASANSGVLDSSGELGGVGNLATQTSAQIGANLGLQMHGEAISQYNQNAADALHSANNHMVDANQWGQIGNLSMSVGSKAANIFATSPTTAQSTKDAFGENSYRGPVNANEWN